MSDPCGLILLVPTGTDKGEKMGYYDPPDYYEVSLDFTCTECEAENLDVTAEDRGGYVYLECEKCGYENEVTLPTEADYCNCGTLCRC